MKTLSQRIIASAVSGHVTTADDRDRQLADASPLLLAAAERMAEYFRRKPMPDAQGIACDLFFAIDKAKH